MSTLTSSLIVRLVDQVSRPARSVSNSLLGIRGASRGLENVSFGGRLQLALRENDRALGRARGGLIDAAAGFYALRTAIAAPVRSAMQFESAMADVAKVVDFPTPEAFNDFQASLLQMSRELPMSVNQLAEMAAIGGSSGLSGDNLLQFVDQAARLGVAFDITAEEAGAFQNAMRNALGMDLTQVLSLGDAINHVSNSMAATAPDLTNFMTRVAGDLAGFGFSAEQATAFGAAMIASGHGADVAATSFRNMGRYLTLGASNSARTRDALASIGLEATDVARRMQEDAVATTLDVFERIGSMPEEMQAALRSDIFGNEARALPGIISNLDLIREALGYVEDEANYAGSAFREFEARAGTFQNAVQLFNNRLQGLQIVVGAALIPAINDLMEAITPVIDRVTAFAQAHPELVANVMAAVASVVAFKVAAAGLRFVGLLGRGGALSLLSLGLKTVGRASLGLYAAAAANVAYQGSLAAMAGAGRLTKLQRLGAALRGMAFAVPGVAALSGVFGWLAGAATAVGAAIAGVSAPVWAAIGVAVAAVAAAGFSLWKWWDTLSATFSGVARRIGEELRPAFEAIQPVLDAISPVTTAVGSAFRGMGEAIGSVIDWFQSRWGEFASWISGFFQREILTPEEAAAAEQRGYDMADRVINAIKGVFIGLRDLGVEAIQNLLAGMQAAWAALNDWAGGVPDRIVSAIALLSSEMLSTGRAMMQSMWDGAVETFSGFIEWLRGIPGRIVEAVGSISLSDIIQWPSPPQWMTDLLGDGEAVNSRIGGISRQDGPTTPSGIALETHEEVQPSAAPYAALSQEQANAAAVLERASTSGLPDEGHLSNLREEATLLQQAISEIQAEIAAAGDSPLLVPNVERANADIRALQTQLQSVQAELTEGERITQEVTAALQVLAGTEVSPEISTDSITRALEQVRALSRELSALRGSVGNVPGPAIDGARASGGDVRSGGTYLVGEEGPELVTFGQRGFVHNARATMRAMRGATARLASGAGFDVGFPDIHSLIRQGSDALSVTGGQMFPAPASVQPTSPQITLNLPAITINGVQDIRGAAGEIRDMLEQELALAMRGLHADLGGA